MNWFLFAVICLLGWGFADLFYKKGAGEDDKRSHLKTAVWVGLVMGVCSLCMLPFSETLCRDGFLPAALLSAEVKYLPASLGYIISMVIGYAGLRYLELSVVSPVQNASGALSAIFMLIYFIASGSVESVTEEYGILDLLGTAAIVGGVISLAVIERKLSADGREDNAKDKKYRSGALALIFPLLYCFFDTVGTAADGIILDEETGLGLGEIDVLVLYGLTFMLAGFAAWIYLWVKNKKPYNPFAGKEKIKGAAALCEEFGQFFYVFAMAENPVLAAPLIASYCIVSVILSRVFLKENIGRRYACVITVIAGIVLLGISEGLGEI